ncbi:HlyD family efflux transporter periplasmic adaptor subunit [Pelagovum pacificum]|uniref:HlyD family efflux transporter periplasmic adaptor subunit n=1 Tax=Pelagovum pacificum TaxID=2588711 RepID=UPI001E5D1E03|nr:HlyD family efflux transporter periplasmic adaptor subunit [Pelagovum pacificum]
MVGVALWVLVGEQMAGASANAVVNAPVVTVRAETAGRLELADRAVGASVSRGEVLGTVTDRLADNVRLNDLLMENDFAQAEIERLRAELEATETQYAALMDRTRLFREERLAELRTRLGHARDRLSLLQSGDLPEQARLFVDASDEILDWLPPAETPESMILTSAEEDVDVLEIAVRAAEQDVFLGDGYNDSPNAEQRAVELQGDIGALEARLAEMEERSDAIETRIRRERLRLNTLSGGDLYSPTKGLYWEVLQANEVIVQRGDPVLRLVNCDQAMVHVSVTEQVYQDLAIGQAASFRMTGMTEVMPATISRLAGTGAERVYENYAVAPTAKHLERFDVALVVPDLPALDIPGCGIGRTGRVFFDGRPLDGIRGLFR